MRLDGASSLRRDRGADSSPTSNNRMLIARSRGSSRPSTARAAEKTLHVDPRTLHGRVRRAGRGKEGRMARLPLFPIRSWGIARHRCCFWLGITDQIVSGGLSRGRADEPGRADASRRGQPSLASSASCCARGMLASRQVLD
jgi:hypothetical protein